MIRILIIRELVNWPYLRVQLLRKLRIAAYQVYLARNTAMDAFRFRSAPLPVTQGAGGNLTLTNNADQSVGAGQYLLSIHRITRICGQTSTGPIARPNLLQPWRRIDCRLLETRTKLLCGYLLHPLSVKSLGKVTSIRAYCARVVSVLIVDLRKFSQKSPEPMTLAGVKPTS